MNILKVKNVVRILSLIAMCFFFIPVFTVSCSGQDRSIGAVDITGGMTYQEMTIVEPHLYLVVLLIIPAVIFALWAKKRNRAITAGVSAVLGVIDVIVWIALRNGVMTAAAENYCEASTGIGYFLNIIVLLLVVFFNVVIVLELADGEDSVYKALLVSYMSVRRKMDKEKQEVMADPRVKEVSFCTKCGSKLKAEENFCTRCGTGRSS